MTFEISENNALGHYSLAQATEDAIRDMESEATDNSIGLRSRWPVMNRGQSKHFRFGNVVGIAGASGAGKSALLNMIRTDFTDFEEIKIHKDEIAISIIDTILQTSEFKEVGSYLVRLPINGDVKFKSIFLHFAYEMKPSQEQLRTVSTLTGINYSKLLSSEGLKDEHGNYHYEKLNPEWRNFVYKVAREFAKRKEILVYNTVGNLAQLYNTVYKVHKTYGSERKITIAIDHTLLSAKLDEKSDQALQDNTARLCVRLKNDFDAMVIPLTQLNSENEKLERRTNPATHYPIKSDIYMGGQYFQACDDLYTMTSPIAISIKEFGPHFVPTTINFNDNICSLIHIGKIKARFGKIGQFWFINALNEGKILPLELQYNKDNIVEGLKILPTLIKEISV